MFGQTHTDQHQYIMRMQGNGPDIHLRLHIHAHIYMWLFIVRSARKQTHETYKDAQYSKHEKGKTYVQSTYKEQGNLASVERKEKERNKQQRKQTSNSNAVILLRESP